MSVSLLLSLLTLLETLTPVERAAFQLRERLELLASELERTWPDAAASLREGMTAR